jgi:hypothetical protein
MASSEQQQEEGIFRILTKLLTETQGDPRLFDMCKRLEEKCIRVAARSQVTHTRILMDSSCEWCGHTDMSRNTLRDGVIEDMDAINIEFEGEGPATANTTPAVQPPRQVAFITPRGPRLPSNQ